MPESDLHEARDVVNALPVNGVSASNNLKRGQYDETPKTPVGATGTATNTNGSNSNNKRRKHRAAVRRSAKRRHSMSKAARDPRDEPESKAASPSRADDADVDADAMEKEAASAVATRSPSPFIDFDGLSRPSTGTRARLEENDEERAVRLEKMRGAVRTILECVGEDPDREGLLGTPDRYAKALLDFTQGYQQNVRNVVNGAIFHEGHNEMVIVKDIEVFSLCEHHMVPFTGKMHIGYIPFHSVIGISKLPRIAEMFSRRLQIQERLTKDVANAIMEILQPQGVAVVMESSHLCMVMRGVQKTSATTITSCVLGCFESKEKTRNEFLSLVGVNR
ncbi:GTP cyclohydrolase 1 [Sporothrix epigloea]|uniref:GTP cyclohydrolase 1 n=1 Tax=Sporothrix epigloea TaxID=1892477 RepID=A0ABP0E2K7_9PEZI